MNFERPAIVARKTRLETGGRHRRRRRAQRRLAHAGRAQNPAVQNHQVAACDCPRNAEGSSASPQAYRQLRAHHHVRQRKGVCRASGHRPCLKAKIFFATPYHAWERGLNENTNGLIRDFFPKGTDFSTISNAEVAKVERLLNARPRKSLGFRSPKRFSTLSLTLKSSLYGTSFTINSKHPGIPSKHTSATLPLSADLRHAI